MGAKGSTIENLGGGICTYREQLKPPSLIFLSGSRLMAWLNFQLSFSESRKSGVFSPIPRVCPPGLCWCVQLSF